MTQHFQQDTEKLFNKVYAICFTQKGYETACRIGIDAESVSKGFGTDKVSLSDWTQMCFCENQKSHVLMIFVGAVGIAVRAISKYIKSKTSDPAVLCIDECGKFVIPILSGHLGGANQAAIKIASILNSTPVITTATDINNKFAVDTWAKSHNFIIKNPENIKVISSTILCDKSVHFELDEIVSAYTSFDSKLKKLNLEKENEKSFASIHLSVKNNNSLDFRVPSLNLIAKIICVGVGCKRGTSQNVIMQSIKTVLEKYDIDERAVESINSIDVKKDEKGIIETASCFGVPFYTYSKNQLNKLEGQFSASKFVNDTVGVDCVCERACICEKNAVLFVSKTVVNGVTVALSVLDNL